MADESPFHFLEIIGSLKDTPRRGWALRGVPARIESVAEHSYRVAVMCQMAAGVRSTQPPSDSPFLTTTSSMKQLE